MIRNLWTPKEIQLFKSLNTPARVQDFIDLLKYNTDDIVRSPRGVVQTKKAHCFDAAIFASCLLDYHKQKSFLVALYANGNDDDHVITVFKYKQYFGAIAKSNYVPIRWRDPVYHSVRELVMSYFEGYFTLDGFRTLRAYSNPTDITKIKNIDWRRTTENLDPLGGRLDEAGRVELLAPWMTEKWLKKNLKLADKRSILGASVGLDLKGVF